MICISCLSFYLIYCYLLSTRLVDECFYIGAISFIR